MYELIGSLGCGSAIVELALARTGVPCTVTDIPYLEDGPERERLLTLNPLGQVPVLLLPDGTVLTESAAMLLHLNDVAPAAGLLPPHRDPARVRCQNLLVVLVAALYPTFTYGDAPPQWTGEGPAAATLRARTDERREMLWRHIDRLLTPGPFALGAQPTAIDLYLLVMSWWRPRRDWFAAHTPGLLAAADAAASLPEFASVIARHRAHAASA